MENSPARGLCVGLGHQGGFDVTTPIKFAKNKPSSALKVQARRSEGWGRAVVGHARWWTRTALGPACVRSRTRKFGDLSEPRLAQAGCGRGRGVRTLEK